MWFFRRRRQRKSIEAQPQSPAAAAKTEVTMPAENSGTGEVKKPSVEMQAETAEHSATQLKNESAKAHPAAEAEAQAAESAPESGDGSDNSMEDSAAKEQEEHGRQKSLYTWHRDKHSHITRNDGEPSGKVTLKNGVVIGEGTPKICVPITGEDRDAVLAQAREVAAAAPDLAEWRVDYFTDLQNREQLADVLMQLQETLAEIPILFTCRTVREGGRGQLPAEDYRSLLLWAAGRPEISLVDVEGMNPEVNAGVLISQIRELGMPVIASYHNFSRTPKRADLELVFQRLEQTGADILKVAVMPKKPKDVMRLMNVTAQMHADLSCPVITMSMGDLGKISRISGRITGSALTFGTCGEASAPGQIPVPELRKLLTEF